MKVLLPHILQRIKIGSVVPTLTWEVSIQSKRMCMPASLEESQRNLSVVTQKTWENTRISPHPVPSWHLNHRTILRHLSYLFVTSPEEMERILHWWTLPLIWGNCLFLLHEYLSLCACSLACFAAALLELLALYSVFLIYVIVSWRLIRNISGALLAKVNLSAWGQDVFLWLFSSYS